MPTTGRRGSIGFGPRHLRSKLGKKKKTGTGVSRGGCGLDRRSERKEERKSKKKKTTAAMFLGRVSFRASFVFFCARARYGPFNWSDVSVKSLISGSKRQPLTARVWLFFFVQFLFVCVFFWFFLSFFFFEIVWRWPGRKERR